MMVFKGDMTVGLLESLVAKGYEINIDADSEYMDISKPTPEPPEAVSEQQV